jgi:hypothetical protein
MDSPLYFIRTATGIFICQDHYPCAEEARAVAAWLKLVWKLPVHFIAAQMRVSFGAGSSLLISCQ